MDSDRDHLCGRYLDRRTVGPETPMEPLTQQRLNIGILGGGITGLTTAYYLLRSGHRVTVLEGRQQVGGLATYFDFGPFAWDKFYHCILSSDRPLLGLIDDLGLTPELRWTETKVGFFTGQGFYSLTTTVDFLKFPILTPWEKFRLGLGVLRISRIRDGKKLESVRVSDWLVRVFGRGNYEKMWGPLLRCKLGACREEASAAFIWATIFRLYSTRDKGVSQKERLGYVRGGYRVVFGRLLDEIKKMDGIVRTDSPVHRLGADPTGGVELRTATETLHFDRVIVTTPSHIFDKLAAGLTAEYRQRLKEVKYLGMVCVVLVLKRRLTPYYVTNLTDKEVPFTGVIEMTNLISQEETAGRYLVYLPKYTAPDDSLFESSDEQVWTLFRSSLQRMFPDLKEDDIERRFVFREKLVQPLPVLNYSERVPPMESPIPGVLLANTTQIINSTLNNNEMVKIAKTAVDSVNIVHRKGPARLVNPISQVKLYPLDAGEDKIALAP
jgi:protoporphyrinogen oxidase